MAITLFQKKDCKGDKLSVSRNHRDLKSTDMGNHPSSVRMTSKDDVVLMFKKDDWHGGVMYRAGKQTIENLGSKKKGGKTLWGNAVTSVRVTPMTCKLNITVVQDGDGTLPGGLGSTKSARARIDAIVALVNTFYADEMALLKLKVGKIGFVKDAKKFRLGANRFASIPGKWKEGGMIDTIFVDKFGKVGMTGLGHSPYWGKTVIVAAKGDTTTGAEYDRDDGEMARTLAHEIGHYLGLSHGSAGDIKGNLMYPDGQGHSITRRRLNNDQIEEMHTKLARNLTRKGDRVE